MKTQDILERLQKYGIQVYIDRSGLLPVYWFIHPDGHHFRLCCSLSLFYSSRVQTSSDYWTVLNPSKWSPVEEGELSFLSSSDVDRLV